MKERQTKGKILRQAWVDDAVKCHRHVVTGMRKNKKMHQLGYALNTIRRTEYWRELGYRNFRLYLKDQFGRAAIQAFGYAEMYRLNEIPAISKYWKLGLLPPENMGLVGPFVTPDTAAIFLPMAQLLRQYEIRQALKSWKRCKRGISGAHRFIPLWVPEPWYERVWKPLEKDPTRAFVTLQTLLEKR